MDGTEITKAVPGEVAEETAIVEGNVNKTEETAASDEVAQEETAVPEKESDTKYDEEFISTLEKKHSDEIKVAVEAALKKASMTEEEKQVFEKDERLKELEEREAKAAERELKLDTIKILHDNGLSEEFLDIVVKENMEVTKKNIATLKARFDTEVQKQVEKRLSGKTPKNGSLPSGGAEQTMAETFRNALNG